MAIVAFNSQLIFGAITRQVGMSPRWRWQEEIIPGVAGVRIYDLGGDGAVWAVEGIIVTLGINYAAALANCVDAVNSGASHVNSGIYDFRDAGGNIFHNCLLTSFQQAGKYQVCDYEGSPACLVRVSGTVRWVSPE